MDDPMPRAVLEGPMKRLLALFLIIAAPCLAQQDSIAFSATAVTNATAQTAYNDVKTKTVTGWAEGLFINVTTGYASPTGTVAVTASGPLGSRTIFSKAVTADGYFPLRDIVCTQVGVDIANTPARVPLLRDVLTFSFYAKNVTNSITATGFLFISDKP